MNSDPDLRPGLNPDSAHSTRLDPEATGPYAGGPGPRPDGNAPSAGLSFRILREHARGGLGEVLVAEDQSLHRPVALKQIQGRYAHDPVSRARFLLEAEITGGLEHPGIVPVHGLGEYADGRPFYVMRLIHGDSLKEAIAHFHEAKARQQAGERTLALRQLLRRFLDVCNAMEYAHSRGVMHRDLKPGNIMVGNYGETLVVDWGLAKILGRAEFVNMEGLLTPALGSDSVLTQAGTVVGTPAYMSPEQAEGRLDQLGPRSDIYSLGATLYCLLTGQAPFPDGTLREIVDRVQRGDFPRPRWLNREVAPALEAVCLKAMALRPEDRYPSARALADDLEHWLADEPVGAYREPLPARGRRWVRRHRPLVAGAVVLLVSAVVTLTASTMLIGQQQRATLAQKQQAERNLALAQKAVEDFLNQVAEHPRLKEADLNDLRKQLLESALPYYEEFVQQRANDPELEAERGRALHRLAKVRALLGENDKALAAYQEMEEVFAALVQLHPETGAYRRDLARSHDGRGQLLATLTMLSRPTEAEQEYRQALALLERLVADFPTTPEYQHDLAVSHFHLGYVLHIAGRGREAEQELLQALAIQKGLAAEFPAVPDYRSEMAASHIWLGAAYRAVGRPEEALREVSKALPLLEGLAAEFPRTSQYRVDLAECHFVLGDVLRTLKRSQEAVREAQQAAALYKSLAREFPSVVEYRYGEAHYSCALGFAQKDAGDLAAALRSIERGRAMFEQLAAAHPEVSDYRKQVADNRLAAAVVRALQGEYRRAAEEVRRINEQPDPLPVIPYNVACFWSQAYGAVVRDQRLTLAERQRLAEDYAARALQWLAKARTGGYFQPGNVQWLKKDPDLDPLRSRPDFQQFLAELEGMKAKGK